MRRFSEPGAISGIDAWGIAEGINFAQVNGDADAWIADQYSGNYNAFYKIRF